MSTRAPELDPPRLHERVHGVVAAGDIAALPGLLAGLHPSDVADVLASLEGSERVALMRVLPVELASEALAEMEEAEDRAELLAALAPERGAELLRELDDDDAADLIAELEPQEQASLLARMPVEDAGDIRDLLRFEEETAGSLMTTSLVVVRADLTAEQALAEVRRQGREVVAFFSVFVVDQDRKLQGMVPLDQLVMADSSVPVAELVRPLDATVLPDVDQEEVGRLMSRYNLVSMAVVDATGVLMGRITFDDVIDVLEAEQTEDLLLLAGVPEDEEIRADWREAVRARLPWLSINPDHGINCRIGGAGVRPSHRVVLVPSRHHADRRWYGGQFGYPIAGRHGAPHRAFARLPRASHERGGQGGGRGFGQRPRARPDGLRGQLDRGPGRTRRQPAVAMGRAAVALGEHPYRGLHGRSDPNRPAPDGCRPGGRLLGVP